MSTSVEIELDNSFVRDLKGMYEPWTAAPVDEPTLLALNDALAIELGLDPDQLRTPAGLALLTGAAVPDGATPVAQAYAGHQFGQYSPRLGDGRALLLGELIDPDGDRYDLHLKGSGRTPFARGGDGLAAVGPMLREFIISEALFALGIPTTRALAVVGTGETIIREEELPGALLVRTAASHLRVGSFQYAAATGDADLLRRLADYAIERHYPDLADAENPYLALIEAVADAQARLVAQWMLVGFIHGVLNTDNVTISGQSIDFGPCAFMEAFDPATVYSSIDRDGRYAFGSQPAITRWNLARFAEALLPLLDEDEEKAVEAASEALGVFAERFNEDYEAGLATKLGLVGEVADDQLINDFLALLHTYSVDFTMAFRSLGSALRGDELALRMVLASSPEGSTNEASAALQAWLDRWRAELGRSEFDLEQRARAMESVNPAVIPRNHLVEEALDAATAGDLGLFERLVAAVRRPYEPQVGSEQYSLPAPQDFGPYQTFCGT